MRRRTKRASVLPQTSSSGRPQTASTRVRRPLQSRLDAFLSDGSDGLAVTVTLPALRSSVQTRDPPSTASSAVAIPSGIVVRSDFDPSRESWIADSKVPGIDSPLTLTSGRLHNYGLYVGEPVADHLIYLRDNRLHVADMASESGPVATGASVEPASERADWKVDGDRLAKGSRIATTPGAIEKLREDLFLVKSQSGPGCYKVTLTEKGPGCSCKDYAGRTLPCKHAVAVRIYLERKGTVPAGAANSTDSERTVVATPRPTYRQAWAAYDAGQAEEFRLFAVLFHDLVSEVPEPERDDSRGGRPRVPIGEQLFCAGQKVYSQMSCRRASGMYGFAADQGLLSKPRHYTIASEVLNREELTPILQRLITRSALPLAALEHGFAPDSTGNRTTSFCAWRQVRFGDNREHLWLKAHVLAGTKTHIVGAAVVTPKEGGDNPQFEPLVRQAAEAGLLLKEVYADKAYSARANYAIAEELGFEFYSPFRNTNTARITLHRGPAAERARSHSVLWRKAFYFFQMHRPEFEAKYHQRSNVESVISAIKRKFGETLRSKNERAQINEALVKILCYNITVLIHEIFEHEVVPAFLSEDAIRRLHPSAPVGEPNGLEDN